MSAGGYRALFLDVGETLVYAHPSSAEVMTAVCAEAGLTLTVAQMEAATSRVWPLIVERQKALGADALYSISEENSRRFWGWFYDAVLEATEVPPAARADLARRFHARFSALETWRLYPDARPLLEEIEARRRRDGLVVGVVSNWEDWLEGLLVSLEVHHYFDFLIVSAAARTEKPDPAIFRAALARAGTDPAETLHVGDSLEADVAGALGVGITPVLLDRRGRYREDQVHGAAIIRSLEALPALLDGGRVPPGASEA